MNKRSIFAVILAFLTFGCDDDSSNLGFSIESSPARLHAPGTVSFELLRDDGESVESCTGNWNFGDGVSMIGDYEAQHRYRDAGSYEVSVDLQCGKSHGSVSTKIEVYGTIDLAISAVECRPLDISSDGTLSVAFQVANLAGHALEVPTYIDVYLTPQGSERGYLASGSSRIYRHTLQSLGAAGSDNAVDRLEFDIPLDASIRTGAYHIAVVVNADESLGESAFDNNVGYSAQKVTVRNQTTDGADFLAKRLQISPTTTSILSSATAQFEYVNQGSTTAETFAYEIWISAKDNATDMNGATKVHESTIDGGMSGVEQIVNNVAFSVSPAISESGLYYFWLKLDTRDDIIERDETNNIVRSASPVQVTNEAILDADITVQSVSFSPSSTSPGGTFSTTIDLYNQGSQPTGSFVCTIFLSSDMSLDIAQDSVVGSINVSDLPALTSRSFSAIMEADTGIKSGKYWVYAFCDSSGVVTEANEDNNIQRGDTQISVTRNSDIDLLLSNAKIETGGTLDDGDTLSLSVMMCNKGTTSAGPSWLSLMRKNLSTSETTEYDRIYVEGLEAGECQTFYSTKPHVCDFWSPIYQFSFIADSTQIVMESDEYNNTSATLTVNMSGDNCICAGDKYEINNAQTSSVKVRSLDEDLTLCSGDFDFFQIDVANGENFEVSLSHDNNRSPLMLTLYRGSEQTASYYGSDHLYISDFHVSGVDENPVYVRVRGYETYSANRYHLNVSTYGAQTGVDVAVSGIEIAENALNASDYHAVSLKLSNIGSEPAGAFYLGYYVSESPDLDENAFLIARQKIDGLAAGDAYTQSASLKLPPDMAGGNYFLIVKADVDDALVETKKTNNIARSGLWAFERSCWDVLDPNESIDSARVLEFSNGKIQYDALAVCQQNGDFYVFHVENGKSLDISVTGETAGDFDIVLYDINGNEIDSSRTGNSTEKIHRDVIVGDQWIYLEVFLLDNHYNAKEMAYSMEISVSDAPEWYNCDPAFEPNNFPTSGYDLKKAISSGNWTALCPAGDEDYYMQKMAAGDRLQVGIESENAGIRAALYYGTNFQFLQMLSNIQTQSLDYTATADGYYFLRVFTNVSDASNIAYRLVNTAESGLDMAISSLAISTDTIQAGELLGIAYQIANEGTEYAMYQTSIALETPARSYTLENLNGSMAVGAQASQYHKVKLPEDYIGDGQIVVQIDTTGDIYPDNNRVAIPVHIDSACLNDANEDNNNILLSSPLSDSTNGVICHGDEDWFVHEITIGETARLEFIHANGDLDLYIYDSAGHEIDRSTTANDVETIALDEDTKYILVKGADSSVQNSYKLEILPPSDAED